MQWNYNLRWPTRLISRQRGEGFNLVIAEPMSRSQRRQG
jgi:hypothetical protein